MDGYWRGLLVRWCLEGVLSWMAFGGGSYLGGVLRGLFVGGVWRGLFVGGVWRGLFVGDVWRYLVYFRVVVLIEKIVMMMLSVVRKYKDNDGRW